ncbi:MAG: helix-turn-helix transcriptional regulator [Sandaracinaceae bacterium]|nr:helix-turn-helix transcriptional regulator [Sandaracinaceae bacterium]
MLGLLTATSTAHALQRRATPKRLAVWEGLVDGRWSWWSSSTRRSPLHARAQEPGRGRGSRGLTDLESRIARLAARGFSDKLVAYHLGIAEGTVSSQLTRAVLKLGLSGRAELVRLFDWPALSRRDHEESNT